MTLREMKIREQGLAGFQQRLNGLGVESSVAKDKLSLECLCLFIGFGIVHQTQLFQDLVVSLLGNLVQYIAHLMHPTPLMSALGINLPDGFPKSVNSITDYQADPLDASPFEASQEVFP